MSEVDELLMAVHRLSGGAPTTPGELADHLARLKGVAAQWSEVLLEVSEICRTLGGAHTATAAEIAYRRAEESFVELEIAHSSATGSFRRRGPGAGVDAL
ncbi:hypothetical protein [Kitasatospora sp. NPDC089509]|uniref:hypothetical protein n=1 Tax=Kitasatospora sp. NPDC089509 TaxID=3364079 RepID=UPI003811C206